MKWETKEISVVDFGAFVLVKLLGGFTAVARCEAEFGAILVFGPF